MLTRPSPRTFAFSVPENRRGGPAIFLDRLVQALKLRGHSVASPEEMVDVRLALVSEDVAYWHGRRIPVVLRLDGACIQRDLPRNEINSSMAKAHALADGIVYQSRFSRDISIRYLGKPNTGLQRIIYNGAPVLASRNDSVPPFPGKQIILAAAQWRPEKRLQDTIRGFLAWNKPDTVLCIAGTDELPVEAANVIALGALQQDELARYYQRASVFIHLCWIDYCPNAVVEALVHSVPVVCTSNGGTKELVRGDGYVIEEPKYDFRPCDLTCPPKLKPEVVARALEKVHSSAPRVHRPDLHIGVVAAKYEQMMLEAIATMREDA